MGKIAVSEKPPYRILCENEILGGWRIEKCFPCFCKEAFSFLIILLSWFVESELNVIQVSYLEEILNSLAARQAIFLLSPEFLLSWHFVRR